MRFDSALATYDAQIANAARSSHVRARRCFGAAAVKGMTRRKHRFSTDQDPATLAVIVARQVNLQ